MKIAIIAAMSKELGMLLPHLENAHKTEYEGLTIHCGSLYGHETAMIECGIGKVNSAIRTYKLIRYFNPELVINSGVAGGISADMKPLTVFIADRVAYHDVWCGPGTAYGAADGFDKYLKPDERIIKEAKAVMPDTVAGLICSGDKFITSKKEVETIQSEFPEVKAVDMESASIGQVCVMEGVPFNIIRVISDNPEENDNSAQYTNFWDEAPKATFKTLLALIENLK